MVRSVVTAIVSVLIVMLRISFNGGGAGLVGRKFPYSANPMAHQKTFESRVLSKAYVWTVHVSY
jgi:hypothetical protein